MKIGELARAAGAKVETVRYYESIGLLGDTARTAAAGRVATPSGPSPRELFLNFVDAAA